MADYRALYRKYRPCDFDDVVGQKAVTDILKYEVSAGKLSHAYLFCGSRGTGKTSCAKILSKAVNCLHPNNGNPCNACEACLAVERGIATDVIEMDAASNNGVDNVRDLKDEIAFTPAELKYRVYIVDEVHMMSASAFNALLKTLEEPPPYVIFILATTEFHKLPSTIVSRCQRFDFKRIGTEQIMSRLFYISEKEGISLTADAARMIARTSAGGMRDAVNLLELCAGGGAAVDADAVTLTVGAGNREQAYGVLQALSTSDYEALYRCMAQIVTKGVDISVFLRDLLEAYRDLAVTKTCADAQSYLDLTDAESALLSSLGASFTMSKIVYHTSVLEAALSDIQRSSVFGRSTAEIALTRMCDPKTSSGEEALLLRIEELEKQVARLRLGVGSAPAAPTDDPPKATDAEKHTAKKTTPAVGKEKTTADTASSAAPAQTTGTPAPYKKWASAVESIAQIKRPLSVQFISAAAYTADARTFTIIMSPFFAKRLRTSEDDLAILRGILSEMEGCAPSEICLDIREKGAKEQGFLSELETSAE